MLAPVTPNNVLDLTLLVLFPEGEVLHRPPTSITPLLATGDTHKISHRHAGKSHHIKRLLSHSTNITLQRLMACELFHPGDHANDHSIFLRLGHRSTERNIGARLRIRRLGAGTKQHIVFPSLNITQALELAGMVLQSLLSTMMLFTMLRAQLF